MKYQVRNGGKGEFEVASVEVAESKTKTWIAKLVVFVIVTLMAFVVIYSVLTGGPATAQEFMPTGERVLLLVLGYYFGRP